MLPLSYTVWIGFATLKVGLMPCLHQRWLKFILDRCDKIYVKAQEKIGIPEDVLFKGQYKFGDKSVTLNADGNIDGLDSVKFYSIENDYIGPGMGDVDILYLGKKREEQLTYCFEFKSDTLFIYDKNCKETDESGTCLDMQKGKLKWTLTKK